MTKSAQRCQLFKITKPMNGKAKIWMQVTKFQNTDSELLFLLWEWLRAEHLSPTPKTLASVSLLKKETKTTMRLLGYEGGQMIYDASHRTMLNTANGCSEETYDRQWLNPSLVPDSNPERPRNVRTTVPGCCSLQWMVDFQSHVNDFKTRNCICVCGTGDRTQGPMHARPKRFQCPPYLGIPCLWRCHSFLSLSKLHTGQKPWTTWLFCGLFLFLILLFYSSGGWRDHSAVNTPWLLFQRTGLPVPHKSS